MSGYEISATPTGESETAPLIDPPDLSEVRLVATDIDGTLLRSDYTISDRARKAIAAAADVGLLIVFVTGRPPRWLDEIATMSGHTGVAVAANGAVTYDLQSCQVMNTHPLAPEAITTITGRLRSHFPHVRFGLEYGLHFGHEPGYLHEWEISPSHDRLGHPIPPPTVAHLDEIARIPAVKLLAKDRDSTPDEFMARGVELLGDLASVTYSSSIPLLEIAAAGVTKATGLQEIANREGIASQQVAAIGDMPNDLPMLEWAGHSFAVANAHQSVRSAANYLTCSNDDDAVAILIEWVLAQQG